jgi:2-dehydropantoate 2-reductase
LARGGWNVTMVYINEAKLEAGRRDGIEVNGVKESNLRFTSFAEWTPAERTILLVCTKTYDNPAVLARIALRHLLVPIQNGAVLELINTMNEQKRCPGCEILAELASALGMEGYP